MPCGNNNCREPNPEYYNNTWGTCKVCRRAYQKIYDAKKAKYNTVNRDTLKEIIHAECENCNENLDGMGSQTCSIANSNEDIKLCPVWQEWKHCGVHPLPNINDYYEEENENG